MLLHEIAHVNRRRPPVRARSGGSPGRSTGRSCRCTACSASWPGRARSSATTTCSSAGMRSPMARRCCTWPSCRAEARPLAAAVGILHWRGELERRIAGLLDEGRSTMTRTNRWLVCIVGLLFLAAGAVTSSTRFVAGREVKHDSAPAAPEPQAAKPEPRAGRTMLVHVLGPDGQPMPGVKVHRSVWTRKPGARGNMDYVSDEHGEVVADIPEDIYICPPLGADPAPRAPLRPLGGEATSRRRTCQRNTRFICERERSSAALSETPRGSRSRALRWT